MKKILRTTFTMLCIFVIGSFGAAALIVGSRFIPIGHDYSEEATVGVITKCGLPFPFAFDAPGYSRSDFNPSAAILDFTIYFIMVVSLIIFIKFNR